MDVQPLRDHCYCISPSTIISMTTVLARIKTSSATATISIVAKTYYYPNMPKGMIKPHMFSHLPRGGRHPASGGNPEPLLRDLGHPLASLVDLIFMIQDIALHFHVLGTALPHQEFDFAFFA